jgi:hypothetical protein
MLAEQALIIGEQGNAIELKHAKMDCKAAMRNRLARLLQVGPA